MEFRDLFSSLKDHITTRVSSPLSGSFIFAWLIINWEVVLTVFSSSPASQKISYIERNVFPSFLDIATSGVLAPLALALLYIYLYPLAALKVFKYAKSKNELLIKENNKIEGKRLLTEEQSDKVRDEIIKIRSTLITEKKRFAEEISAYESQVQELQEDILHLESQLEKQQVEKINYNMEKIDANLIAGITLESFLTNRVATLHYNPENGGKKDILFDVAGLIRPSNNNEFQWRVNGSYLEFINADGKIQSRFQQTATPYHWEHVSEKFISPTNQYFEVSRQVFNEGQYKSDQP